MLVFASHVFLLNLVRYVLASPMQRTHNMIMPLLGRFFESLIFLSSCRFHILFVFLSAILFFAMGMSVLCRIVVRCFMWYPCWFCVLDWYMVPLYMWFLESLLYLGCVFTALFKSVYSVYLLLKEDSRVFCLWKRVPGLGE